MQRLINPDADVAWNPITIHLVTIIRHPLAPPSIRLQATHVLNEVLLAIPRSIPPSGELIAIVQRRVVDALAAQIMLEGGSNTVIDIRKMGLETLHQILQSGAHAFVEGWETIFDMLGSVCKPINNPPLTASSFSAQSQDSLSPSPSTPSTPRARPPPLNVYANDRSMLPLIRIAFQSLTLVCDNLAALSPDQLKLCITTLGLFGRQTDTNIALTAAESLLWAVSDSIQLKRKDLEQEPVYSALWMFLLLELLRLCTDARPEVRGGAIQTLFRTLQLYGSTLSLETWEECMWKVVYPVVESITASMRQAAALSSPDAPGDTSSPSSKAWDDSKILALQSLGGIFHDFEVEKILHIESFERVWDRFLGLVQDSFANDNKSISSAALRCLERAVKAFGPAGDSNLVQIACEKAWDTWAVMGTLITESASGRRQPTLAFSQECLVAYVDAVKVLRAWSRQLRGREWDLERLTRLAAILMAVLTYPHSKDYRPDVDALTPVQVFITFSSFV
jgi:C-terminal region of Mon2 protein